MRNVAVLGADRWARRLLRDLSEAGLRIRSISTDPVAMQTFCSRAGIDVSVEGIEELSDMAKLLEGYDRLVVREDSPDIIEHICRYCGETGTTLLSTGGSPASLEALRRSVGDASAIGGVDWSPGLTGLLARLGRDELGGAEMVQVSWALSLTDGQPEEALSLLSEAFDGPAVVFEDGEWGRRSAGSDPEQVFFPEPLGWREVRTVSATEPESLPASLGVSDRVLVKGTIADPGIGRSLGFWMRRRKATSGFESAVTATATRLVAKIAAVPRAEWGWSCTRVDIRFRGSTKAYAVVDHLANIRSGLATAALTVIDSEKPGLQTLETAAEPKAMLSALRQHGIRVAELGT